jgi:hypothetical protein
VVGKAVVASCHPENMPESAPAQHFATNDPGEDITTPTTAQIASHEAKNPLGGGPHENGLRGPQPPKRSILDLEDEELHGMIPKELVDLWEQAQKIRELEKTYSSTHAGQPLELPVFEDLVMPEREASVHSPRRRSMSRSQSPSVASVNQPDAMDVGDEPPAVMEPLPPNTSARMAPGQVNSMAAKKSQSKSKSGSGSTRMVALEDQEGMERLKEVALQRVIARLKRGE